MLKSTFADTNNNNIVLIPRKPSYRSQFQWIKFEAFLIAKKNPFILGRKQKIEKEVFDSKLIN